MKDALLVVDAINDFEHEDGDVLLSSFRDRLGGLRAALAEARGRPIPVIYANDRRRHWDGDVRELVREALAARGGDVVGEVAPQRGDPFLLKSHYSAFHQTGLTTLLEELEIERLLLIGGATEACIIQSAIQARELGFKVTILADACATIDRELETISLRYAEQVAGVFIARTADTGEART
jgi:nicotinamidase-related amidase